MKHPLQFLYCGKSSNILYLLILMNLLYACGLRRQSAAEQPVPQPAGPTFSADSAYRYCQAQCDFGPRVMNSPAHDACGEWIADKFRQFGLDVTLQQTVIPAFDGTRLRVTNIIAAYRPELTDRILLCAHWDSRPWADNDPDSANHRKPVLAANDGASGVAVMLEVARLVRSARPAVGIDFICFDAEDYGFPYWAEGEDPGDTWALGSQYWAAHLHKPGYTARFGILLDMVGGQGAQFYREGMSVQYASAVVDRVWRAAQAVGFGSTFPQQTGGYITDDHISVNTVAHIPCIDIIPYYPDCEQSSFGPTWHTLADDMAHIDKTTLQAVGQTVIQVLFSE